MSVAHPTKTHFTSATSRARPCTPTFDHKTILRATMFLDVRSFARPCRSVIRTSLDIATMYLDVRSFDAFTLDHAPCRPVIRRFTRDHVSSRATFRRFHVCGWADRTKVANRPSVPPTDRLLDGVPTSSRIKTCRMCLHDFSKLHQT